MLRPSLSIALASVPLCRREGAMKAGAVNRRGLGSPVVALLQLPQGRLEGLGEGRRLPLQCSKRTPSYDSDAELDQ
jgi:hypothetical protein